MRNKKRYQLQRKKQKKYTYSRKPYINKNNKFIKILKYILKEITILLLFTLFIIIKKKR